MSHAVWAAVGSDGTRPVVWAIGESIAEIRWRVILSGQCPDEKALVFMQVDPYTVARYRRGIIDAKRLGLEVRP